MSAEGPVVGATSPSLCPTIDSVINTGTCSLPLCTAIVNPTISGEIDDDLAQVLIGFLFVIKNSTLRVVRSGD